MDTGPRSARLGSTKRPDRCGDRQELGDQRAFRSGRETLEILAGQAATESCKLKFYILESLIQRSIGSPSSHAAAVVNVLEGIENTYGAYRNTGAVPTISDPGYASVNLAKHWQPKDFTDFIVKVKAAAGLARRAFDSQDEAASRKLWRQVFGLQFGQ